MDNKDVSRTELLALERTKLANERTFLAYFRTFIVFVSSGFAIIKIDLLSSISKLGYFFIIVAFIVLLVGIGRLLYVKKKIRSFYK